MIRAATDADASALFRLAREMIDEAPAYRAAAVDPYRLNAMIERLTAAGTLLVAESVVLMSDDWKEYRLIAGFMAYLVAPNWLTGEPEACDVALYALPECRGAGMAQMLVAEAIRRATEAGCVKWHAGVSTGGDAGPAGSVYAGMGFTQGPPTWCKVLAAPVRVA